MDNLWLRSQSCTFPPANKLMGELVHLNKLDIIIFFYRQVSPRQTSVLDTDMPIPPYMPMQSSTSKKSASLERKIKKKKEKEGCKQQ